MQETKTYRALALYFFENDSLEILQIGKGLITNLTGFENLLGLGCEEGKMKQSTMFSNRHVLNWIVLLKHGLLLAHQPSKVHTLEKLQRK